MRNIRQLTWESFRIEQWAEEVGFLWPWVSRTRERGIIRSGTGYAHCDEISGEIQARVVPSGHADPSPGSAAHSGRHRSRGEEPRAKSA